MQATLLHAAHSAAIAAQMSLQAAQDALFLANLAADAAKVPRVNEHWRDRGQDNALRGRTRRPSLAAFRMKSSAFRMGRSQSSSPTGRKPGGTLRALGLLGRRGSLNSAAMQEQMDFNAGYEGLGVGSRYEAWDEEKELALDTGRLSLSSNPAHYNKPPAMYPLAIHVDKDPRVLANARKPRQRRHRPVGGADVAPPPPRPAAQAPPVPAVAHA